MAEPIGALRVMLEANSASLEAGMKRARDAVSTNSARMKRALSDVERGFGKLETAALRHAKYAVAAAAAGAAYGFVRLTKDAITAADAIWDTAQVVGTSTESLSKLQYAAKVAGVEVEALTKGMVYLSRTMTEAAAGKKEYVEALASVGMTVRDITTATGALMPVDQVLAKIADRFASLPDGPMKAAAAIRLFGRAGAPMIVMLNEGSAGLERLGKQATMLGIVIGDDLAKRANDMNDQLEAMKGGLLGVGLSIAEGVIPRVMALTQTFLAAKAAGDSFWSSMRQGVAAMLIGTEFEQRVRVLKTLQQDMETMRAPWSVGNAISKGIARATWGTETFLQAEIDKQTAAIARLGDQAKKTSEALSGVANPPGSGKTWEEILKDLEDLNAGVGKQKTGLSEAEQAARRLADAYADTRDEMERELDLVEQRGRLAKLNWEIERGALQGLAPDRAEELRQLARQVQMLELVGQLEQASAARQQELAQRAAEIVADNMTDAERLRADLAELDRLHKSLPKSLLVGDLGEPDAPLDDAQYEIARRRLLEVAKAEQEVADGANDVTVNVGVMVQAFDSFAQNTTDALVDFAMTGEASFAAFTRAVLRDLLRIELQAQMTTMRLAWMNRQTGAAVLLQGAHLAQGVATVGAGTTGTIGTGGSYVPAPAMKLAATPQLDVGARYAGLASGAEPAGKPGAGQSIRIVNVLDPAVVNDWAASPSGEKVILNAIARHATQIRAMVR